MGKKSKVKKTVCWRCGGSGKVSNFPDKNERAALTILSQAFHREEPFKEGEVRDAPCPVCQLPEHRKWLLGILLGGGVVLFFLFIPPDYLSYLLSFF